MKTRHAFPAKSLGLLGLLSITLGSGCSSMSTHAESDDALAEAANRPAVLYVRAEPGTIDLDSSREPSRPSQILADVKDFGAAIKEVKLRFVGLPLDIPMENVGGSTWRALLTPRQLELLSVSGQTIEYEAKVYAKDEKGKVGISKAPLIFAVRTQERTTG